MTAYYNEIEPFCGHVLETNIARKNITPGKVDIRDIRDVQTNDAIQFRQIHLFAGIGAAAYACRLAGLPDDFSIATCGFPCQDISTAGKGAGIGGERSGLFWHALALLESLAPTWILFENVPALRTRGIEPVLAALEIAGYCALDPIVVGADDIGAPQRRKRVWIVARNANGTLANTDGFSRRCESQIERRWEPPRTIEPPMGSDPNGIAPGLVRRWTSWRRNALKGLGNAWVPQTAVPILKWIYQMERNRENL